MNRIVTRGEWLDAHGAIYAKEKSLTREHDRLAAERRRLPWECVEKAYRFNGPDGERRLGDLFADRRQLIVYHHMLRPNDSSPCAGCGMVGDQMPHLAHFHARNTSLVFVSKAPIREIESFKERMGWRFPWVETIGEFNADFGVTTGFGLNVFFRDGDTVYRTYFTTGRGLETLGTAWTLLDLTPWGRQESWEDSPPGVPQDDPYRWWRLHDEY